MLKPLNDFTAYSTGQQGIALADIVNVQINYGVGDTGIVDDGGSMATLLLETLSGPGVFWKDHYKTFQAE